MSVVAFTRRDGSAHFRCVDCGCECYHGIKIDSEPRCFVCRYIAAHPDLPADVVARIQGTAVSPARQHVAAATCESAGCAPTAAPEAREEGMPRGEREP